MLAEHRGLAQELQGLIVNAGQTVLFRAFTPHQKQD